MGEGKWLISWSEEKTKLLQDSNNTEMPVKYLYERAYLGWNSYIRPGQLKTALFNE